LAVGSLADHLGARSGADLIRVEPHPDRF